MQKISFFIVIVIFVTALHAQSPQKVYRITQEYYSNDWYKIQSELWEKEIEKNPQNAEAWENYYYANRYARFEDINSAERQAKLAKIIDEMGKAIPNSYEYTLLKAWNSHDVDDISGFEKAYHMNPDRPDPLYSIITHYELAGNSNKVEDLYHALYKAHDTITPLLDYNYNVLMSIEDNGILITNGDNDTYPARMLQIVKGVRPDVTIINISMAMTEKYLTGQLRKNGYKIDFQKIVNKVDVNPNDNPVEAKKQFLSALIADLLKNYPNVHIYFALTVYDPFKEQLKDKLYLTGLAELYSPAPLDNVALLRKNIEHQFRLDDVLQKWYAEEYVGKNMMSQMNLNYVPAFIKLAEHYQLAGESWRADLWAKKAKTLAKAGHNEELVQFIESKGFENN